MKQILFATFFLINAALAMEKKEITNIIETPFPEEAFVDPDDAVLVPGKAIWNFYDGSRTKHLFYPNLNLLIKRHLEAIIARKCGSQALSLFKDNPDDVRSQIMSRYGRAVCWQIQKYHNDTTDIAPDVIIKAERQVPFNLNELIYIEQNIQCYGSYNDPAIKQELKDLENKSRAENRAYLNSLLNTIKSSIQERK